MKVAIKKSDCIKGGAPLLAATKKDVQKKFIPGSKVEYCITVEPFPMSYAYSEQISQGEKFTCDIFSIN